MASSSSSSSRRSPGDGRTRRSGPLAFLASLYDLDTLDTRFTTPSSVPYRASLDKREDDAPKPPAAAGAEPSKWNTLEFYGYYLVFLTVVPYMFWVAYDVSRRRCSLLGGRFSRRLVGWLCWLDVGG